MLLLARLPRVLLLLALALVSGTGCSVSHVAGGRWIEVKGERFRVVSDAGEAQTARLVGELEAFPALLERLTGSKVPLNSRPLEVFAFDSSAAFRLFRGDDVTGFFQRTHERSYIAFRADLDDWRETVYHELVHHLLSSTGKRYPDWYEEGLAEFVRTVRLDSGKAELGRPPPRPGLLLLREAGGGLGYKPGGPGGLPLRSELSTDVKYAFGWAMVSYLTLGHAAGSGRDHRPCLSRYLDLLQTGMADGDAFAEAFGVGFPEFKQRVYRYVAKDEFPLVRIPYGGVRGMPGLKAALLSRVLPQARTAVALGDLSEAIGRSDVAVEFYRRAHRLDPREPEALAGLGWQEAGAGNPEAARKHFEAALRYGEANPVVRASYGAFLLDQAQREKDWVRATELVAAARGHFSRAVQLDPENAIALLGLGKSCLIDCPDLQEGIRVVKEVGEVIPGSPSIQLALGRLFAKAQDWANARVQFEAVLRSNATVEAKQHATQALTQMAERTK